jgi:uncharacterized protein YkwD
MRTLAFLALSLIVSTGSVAIAQTLVSSNQTYVCPKCGKVHVRSTTPATGSPAVPYTTSSSPVRPASYSAPVASTSRLRGGGPVRNVLAALNAQRARQGVPSLRYDPQLQAVAQRRAQQMASRGYKNHPPGSFAPGRYEGVGWSSSYSPSGVSACYTSDSRMKYAGAAMATGSDGVYFAVVYR